MDRDGVPTAIACLSAAARAHGVQLDPAALTREHSLTAEPDLARLIAIAEKAGLHARHARHGWEDLIEDRVALPAIARLRNGNSVLLVRVLNGRGAAVILDPLAQPPAPLRLERAEFEKAWAGDLLLVRRAFQSETDPDAFGVRWYYPEFSRLRETFGDILLAAIFLQLLSLVLPVFFQLVIDKVLLHQGIATLYALAAGAVIALVFEAVMEYLKGRLLLFASTTIDVRTGSKVFRHLLNLRVDFFSRIPAGILSRDVQQTGAIRRFFTGTFLVSAIESLSLAVVLPLLYWYSPLLFAIVLGFALLVFVTIALLLTPYRERLNKLYEQEGQKQSVLVETIHGIETVKALSLEKDRTGLWEDGVARAGAQAYRVGSISVTTRAVTTLAERLSVIAVVGIGALQVFEGRMTVGELVAFQMLAGRVSAPLARLASLVHEMQEMFVSLKMLGTIMNEKPEPGMVGATLRPQIAGGIDFENVSFRYSDTRDPVIERASFSIAPGSVTGLVGSSGSGKTTVLRLIQGLYTAHAGVVRVDGFDLRQIDLHHLRANIAVVLQESFFFRGTVAQNIRITRPDAPIEDVVAAARLAAADSFIQELPRGYETDLAEGGVTLSGGQRQRLAIARALLRDPRILILDEATSALDVESELAIRDSLRQIAAGRTMLLATHKLQNLALVSRIIVLGGGGVADVGSHDELLKRCELYQRLWEKQSA